LDWDFFFTTVTALVALYGAILSTLNWRKDRLIVKVKIDCSSWGSFFASNPLDSLYLSLVIQNYSLRRTITLETYGFRLPDFSDEQLPVRSTDSDSFPCKLFPHENCKRDFRAVEIADYLLEHKFPRKVRLVGFYRDALGKEHKSNPFQFNVDASDCLSFGLSNSG